jgi:hypothetical protein
MGIADLSAQWVTSALSSDRKGKETLLETMETCLWMTANRLSILWNRVRFSLTRRMEEALVVTEAKRTFWGPSPELSKLPDTGCSMVPPRGRQSASRQTNMTQNRYFKATLNISMPLQAFATPVDDYFIYTKK